MPRHESTWQPSSRPISVSKSGRGPIFDISETVLKLKVHQSPKQKTLFILVLIQIPLAHFHPPRGSVRVGIFQGCFFLTRDSTVR